MWKEGSIRVNGEVFHYWMKQYDKGSEWGIDGGRISKLMLMAHCIEHILRENAAKDIVLHMAIRVLQQGISIYFPILSVTLSASNRSVARSCHSSQGGVVHR